MVILTRLKQLVGPSVKTLRARCFQWTRPLTSSLPLQTLADLGRSKSELVAENALLRMQLIVLRRQVKRPACMKTDRVLLVLLARVVRTWKQAHITRSARHEARGGIGSSSACIGSASQRLLLTSPR
jgi:putative transposase